MDTGNLGESILAKWCHQVDLIPNRVTVDKDGWDFLVALPPEYGGEIKSLDKDDSHDRILVQVKTTTQEKGNREIKLSNLKKLVNAPIPSFYLLIQVDSEGEPHKAYLFHVWEEIIKRVQKKVRTIPKEEWSNLHNYHLTLPWKIAKEIDQLHGSELKLLFKESLTGTKKSYSEDKYLLREKVGYEDGKGQINFKGKLPDKYKDDIEAFFVDLYLGEVGKVEVSDFELTDIRFGNEIVVDKHEGGHFSLKNIEPEGPAAIKFISKDHKSSVEIDAEYFIPRGIGVIVKDEGKWKILYKAPFIKFSIYPKSKKVEFLFEIPDFNTKVRLLSIIDITDLMIFLNSLEGEERVEFEIRNQGKPTFGGNLVFNKYQDEVPLEYFRAIKSASSILNYLNLKTDIDVSPNELKAQDGLLNFINELLAPKPTYMRIEFTSGEELSNYSTTIGLVPYTITIGNYLLPIQFKIQGIPSKTGGVDGEQIFYELKSNDIRIEQYRILKREKDDALSAHNKMKEQSIEKYDTDDLMVFCFYDKD